MKRLLSAILTMALLLSFLPALPLTASAATVAPGTCGDNLTWTLDDAGTLTISGTGEMYDFYWYDDSPWYDRRESVKKAVITEGVTSIGDRAFYDCYNLTSINIPDSVTSIGSDVFCCCFGLTSITIPDSVTSIGDGAFSHCIGLTGIAIPDSVTSIGDSAFSYCPSLTSITIPDSVTSIGRSAFECCTGLTSITIPDSVTSIRYCAFYGCYSLTSITIPDSVTSIGDYAFYDCYNLTSINIPDSVTSIGIYAVYRCTGLTSITIPDSVTSIGIYAFSDCTGLTSITIPDSVTSIGEGAFCGCTGLTGITIPDSVTSIGDYAFSYCDSLTSITIPDSVTSIGSYVFSYCYSLTSITIPDSVTSIGRSAFECCTGLTSITIPDSVTSIGDYAFFNCYNLADIILPTSVTGIGEDAFQDCNSLNDVYYKGTKAQAEQIEGRSELASATWHYQFTGMLKIVSQPDSGCGAYNGETVTVSVGAIGDGLKYQWYYKNAWETKFTPTTAFTGNTYSVQMNESRNGRQIYCVITDKYGNSAQSDTATLSLWQQPVYISREPESVTVPKGQTATVSFTAEGDGLTYAWYYRDAGTADFIRTYTFSGNTYTAQMNEARNGRQLYCVVTDAYGNSAQTNVVSIHMQQPLNQLEITRQPKSVTVSYGETATVSFEAQGDGLTYKWYYKNKGADSFIHTTTFSGNTYTAQMNADRDGRELYCVVTDKYGNTAQTDTVSINMDRSSVTPLRVVTQPKSVTVPGGQMATVSFSAEGDGLAYKWYYKNAWETKFTLTTSFTGNTYSAQMNDSRNGRQIYCVVTDQYGNSVQTNTVSINMEQPRVDLKITKQPVSVTVANGAEAKVSFAAQGNGLTYKWYYKNTGDSGFAYTASFTGNTYTVQMSAARAGRQIYCVVTDQYGDSVQTNTVTLNMSKPVKITQQPTSVTVLNGEYATVTVEAEGEGLKYQWYYKNAWETKFTPTTAFTGNTYSVQMNESRDGRQIYCVITDKYGNSAQTKTVTIRMTEAVANQVKITKQPRTVIASNGKTATVSFTAKGEGLTYKWYYRNSWETGAFAYTPSFTGNSYSVVMDSTRSGRQLYCVVTDRYGNTAQTDTVGILNSGSVSYTIKRDDRSYYYSGHKTLSWFYDLVVVNGNGTAKDTINAGLRANRDRFFTGDWDDVGYRNYDLSYPYQNSVDASVSHNADGILSIRYHSDWWMGGVHNDGVWGSTYDLATGKEMNLSDFAARKGVTEAEFLNTVRAKTWESMSRLYGNSLYDDAKSTLYDYDLDEFSFYIKNGQIYITFPEYEMTSGAGPIMDIPTGIYIN